VQSTSLATRADLVCGHLVPATSCLRQARRPAVASDPAGSGNSSGTMRRRTTARGDARLT
jgi:hypothetical protein